MIDRFEGEYEFLSNFYPCKIVFEDIEYPSVEHAFQAAKCRTTEEKLTIAHAKSPGLAKRIGRTVELVDGWNSKRIEIMYKLLKIKFRDKELREKLISTNKEELVEGNYWNDTYWGVCKNTGENHLGKLLMQVRAEINIV